MCDRTKKLSNYMFVDEIEVGDRGKEVCVKLMR
jgi:hypothetical protein